MKTTIKSFGAIVSCIALLALVLASCASAGVIFQDDFNDGNKDGWTDAAGTPWWSLPGTSVVGNEFAWNGLGVSTANALDGQGDLDITVAVPNPGLSEAIVLKYVDGANYTLAFHNNYWNYMNIFQAIGGNYTFNNQVDTPGITGPFSMHAVVVGNNVTFDMTDGTNTYSTSYTLTPVIAGIQKFGLWGDSGSAGGHNDDGILHYDNFVASTVPEPGSLLALASGLVCIAGMIRRRH